MWSYTHKSYRSHGFIQVFREWGIKLGKNSAMKIPGVSYQNCKFCMFLRMFQLGNWPLFCPWNYLDKRPDSVRSDVMSGQFSRPQSF